MLPVFRAASDGPKPHPYWTGHSAVVDPAVADISEAVTAFLEATEIPVLNLSRPFDDLGPADVALDTWHPNAEGHRLIARELVRAMGGNPAC